MLIGSTQDDVVIEVSFDNAKDWTGTSVELFTFAETTWVRMGQDRYRTHIAGRALG